MIRKSQKLNLRDNYFHGVGAGNLHLQLDPDSGFKELSSDPKNALSIPHRHFPAG